MKYITLKLFSVTTWQAREIESLVTQLEKQTVFRPDRWGPYEPLAYNFSKSELTNIQARWESKPGAILLFEQKLHGLSIMVVKDLPFKKPNWITVSLDEDFFTSENQTKAFLDFAKQLFEWSESVYGYACHRADFEQKNILPIPTKIEGKLITTGGSDIRRCLPGIYWVNFFSGQYVDWFGKNKFRDLPSYASQNLPNAGQMILSSGSPLEFGRNNVLEREWSIRKRLSESAFFNIKTPILITDSPFKDGTIQIE